MLKEKKTSQVSFLFSCYFCFVLLFSIFSSLRCLPGIQHEYWLVAHDLGKILFSLHVHWAPCQQLKYWVVLEIGVILEVGEFQCNILNCYTHVYLSVYRSSVFKCLCHFAKRTNLNISQFTLVGIYLLSNENVNIMLSKGGFRKMKQGEEGTREGYVFCTWLKWRCHWVITSATEVQRLCQNEFGKPTPVRPASALMHSNVLWIGANLNHGMLWKVGRLECSGKGSKPQSHVFTQSPFKKMWANNHVVAGLVGDLKSFSLLHFYGLRGVVPVTYTCSA